MASNEKPYGTARENRVMLWVIPAAVAGEWRLATPDVRFTVARKAVAEVTAIASQERRKIVDKPARYRAGDCLAGR